MVINAGERKNMKRILCSILSAFCILLCVGCAGDIEQNTSDETKSEFVENVTVASDATTVTT